MIRVNPAVCHGNIPHQADDGLGHGIDVPALPEGAQEQRIGAFLRHRAEEPCRAEHKSRMQERPALHAHGVLQRRAMAEGELAVHREGVRAHGADRVQRVLPHGQIAGEQILPLVGGRAGAQGL